VVLFFSCSLFSYREEKHLQKLLLIERQVYTVMEMTLLEKLGETLVLTFPASVIEALQLHAGEALAIEVQGDRIVLTRAPAEFRALWVAYQTPGQRLTPQIAS
jgi:antitoxin component of MazEF toxin-antitoxin module